MSVSCSLEYSDIFIRTYVPGHKCSVSHQTMEQRVRTQKLKDKRKAALDARLAKVRERKLKKLKASGELDEESNEDSGQTEGKEEKVLDNVGQPTTEQDVKESLPDREDHEVDSYRRPVRKAELPEWAQHKISKSTVQCNCTVLVSFHVTYRFFFSHFDFFLDVSCIVHHFT